MKGVLKKYLSSFLYDKNKLGTMKGVLNINVLVHY
jgi:hypothetical protein